eukprot:876597-Alexandrium_andersonii.AAC.1
MYVRASTLRGGAQLFRCGAWSTCHEAARTALITCESFVFSLRGARVRCCYTLLLSHLRKPWRTC